MISSNGSLDPRSVSTVTNMSHWSRITINQSTYRNSPTWHIGTSLPSSREVPNI